MSNMQIGESNHIHVSKRKLYVEWMLIILFICIYFFIAYGIGKNISQRNQTNLVFMLFGLVNILSANVLSKLYNYTVPEFIAFLRMTPLKTRLFGIFFVCLSLLRMIY
jgi:hypothetical protein